MESTFLSPNTCGFARIVAVEIAREVPTKLKRDQGESNYLFQARIKKVIYDEYKNHFQDFSEKFAIQPLQFQKRLPGLRDAINKWNVKKSGEKKKYMDTFSRESWKKLSHIRKEEHSFSNCRGCIIRYSSIQALFNIKSSYLKGKAKKNNPVLTALCEVNNLRSKEPSPPKPNKADAKNAAKAIYNKVAPYFEKTYNMNFAEGLSRNTELSLQYKNTNERRKERRSLYRSSKENIEKQMEETAFLRCYGGGLSLNSWQRSRMASSFEPKSTARKRKHDDQNKNPSKKAKCHTGAFESMVWDKKRLREKVEELPDGHVINYTSLAKEFNICDGSGNLALNGGQIVKEYLKSEGVDVSRFQSCVTKRDEVIRRKKRKGKGSEISVPTEITTEKLKDKLREKLESGEYTVGEMIVPCKYEKLVLTKDLKIERREFITSGRKIPLTEIREKMLIKQEPYLRARTEEMIQSLTEDEVQQQLEKLNELTENKSIDEMREDLKRLERSRSLLVWLDNSTVANHGYLVCMVTCLYDPAVFYTDSEFKELTGQKVSIQKIIEKPEIHFIARSGSSDEEQMLYSETRLKCIQEIDTSITLKNVPYVDIMRFSHGDSPQRACEAGHQKGGNYFCSGCAIHASMVDDIDHALNCKLQSLQSKRDAILKGAVARRNSLAFKIKPLKGLSKGEIEEELTSRKVYDDGTKAELQGALDEQLCGKQRVPALLFSRPGASLESLNLSKYEILPCEPLHDIGHHIENVLTELPHHLSEDEANVINESIKLSLGKKESKRAIDYRIALVQTTAMAHQSNIVSERPLALLDTLVQMQEILYSPEDKRSTTLILRYLNQSWYHSILLNSIIRKPKKLTRRKLFGVYYHNLTSHAGLMIRLISGLASNAEEQERTFNAIKRITKQTSNYNPEQIIPNLMIRLQAEKELELRKDDVGRQQSQISKLKKSLPPTTNTQISKGIIMKYNREWQAHLQRISDFLVEKEGVWWSQNDQYVEFHDVTNVPENSGPQLHHFRSSCLEREELVLDELWKECIDKKIVIPTNIIRTDNNNNTTTKQATNFLHLEEDESDDTGEETANVQEQQDVIMDIYPQYDDITYEDDCPVPNTHPKDTYPEQNPTLNSINTEEQTKEKSLSSENNQEEPQLKSSLGKSLRVVLGPTVEVQSIDNIHYRLKKKLKQQIRDTYLEKKYDEELVKIQSKVLKAKRITEKNLKAWEKNYFLENSLQSPTLDDIKKHKGSSEMLKQIKHANALLHQWKMRF